MDKLTLKDGLTVDGITHKEVELRAITAGDILDANEQSQEVFLTKNGPVLMAPTDKVMAFILRRIIVKLGDMQMPLAAAEFKKLTARDFDILTDYYITRRTSDDLSIEGRDNPPL